MELAKDIMAPATSGLKLDQTVRQALRTFMVLNVQALPVLRSSGRPMGIFTEQALIRAIVLAHGIKGLDTPISEVVDILEPVYLVAEDETFLKLTHSLISSNANHLMVVDKEEKWIGMIRPIDLLKRIDLKES